MGIVIMKHQDFVAMPESAQKMAGRLQQVLISWMALQSSMQGHWDRYRTRSTGRHVPYRVWLRHGAYLEMKRELSRH